MNNKTVKQVGPKGFLLRQAVAVPFFSVLTIAITLVFMKAFAPRPPLPERVADETYSNDMMRKAISPDGLAKHQQAILKTGSRFPGQPGMYAAGKLIRDAYVAAGLELYELEEMLPAPRTGEARILDAGQKDLSGVSIYPLFPNLYQPMVTTPSAQAAGKEDGHSRTPATVPPPSVKGLLLKVTDEILADRSRFDDCIALVDAANPPKTIEMSWSAFAQMGFQAVILSCPDGLDKMPWKNLKSMIGNVPTNYVRLIASPEIFKHGGEQVALHVRTEFAPVRQVTLVGILRAGKMPAENREALVVVASYDAPSLLPDLAPGTLSAVAPAIQLALLDGLKKSQSNLQRDVIFVSSGSQTLGHTGIIRMLSCMGPSIQEKDTTRVRLTADLDTDRRRLEAAGEVLRCFDEASFMADPAATDAAIVKMGKESRVFLQEQVSYVMKTVLLEHSDEQLSRQLDFIRGGEKIDTPSFEAYIQAKRRHDAILTVEAYPIVKLLEKHADLSKEQRIKERCLARFKELRDYHQKQVTAGETALKIHDLMKSYGNLIVVSPDILPTDPAKTGTEKLSITMGPNIENNCYLQYPVFNAIVDRRVQLAGLDGLRYEGIASSKQGTQVQSKVPDIFTQAEIFNYMGYPAVSFINTDRQDSYQERNIPIELPYMRNLETIRNSSAILGDTVLWLAHGNGAMRPSLKSITRSFSGFAYVANVGQSAVPSYPLAGAIWSTRRESWDLIIGFGYYCYPLVFTDPYGRYCLADISSNIAMWSYTPEIIGYSSDGLIRFVKDEGRQGQAIYRSMNINNPDSKMTKVNVVVFRSTAVTVLDLVNPQTMQPYAGVEFLLRDSLAPPPRSCSFKGDNTICVFMEPDQQFYLALKAGTQDNPNAQKTRAFILGNDRPGFVANKDKEIDGEGYLAADFPLLYDTSRHVAASMQQVNGGRLKLQEHFNMADSRTREFHDKALERLQEISQTKDAAATAPSFHRQTQLARESATYSILNHPVLRDNTSQAIIGILWYLGLLVPFCFFFEKLAFGFADVRKQLLTQMIVLLVVFCLLKELHPAFEMIRSSLMILLGFVIMLVSAGITMIFSGKFQENLEELRKRRGMVQAAEINTMGVIGTAFLLGLNNMHRRKVRTGLTCATLVLITFAMICFTSVTSDLKDEIYPLGKAQYQGFLVKYPEYRAISTQELGAINAKYGQEYSVAPRYAFVGHRSWEQQLFNPEIEIVYEPSAVIAEVGTPTKDTVKLPAGSATALPDAKSQPAKKANASTVLVLTDKEPLRDRIKLLTSLGWFPELSNSVLEPLVMIPDDMAESLKLSVDDVNTKSPVVKINGKRCRVYGIFSSESLSDLRDLDGRPILPFDAEAVQNPRVLDNNLLASDTDTRVSAKQVVLTSSTSVLQNGVNHAYIRLMSISVDLQTRTAEGAQVSDTAEKPVAGQRVPVSYKEAKSVIDSYLEQQGKETYYGMKNVAYKGQVSRGTGISGIIELLIPLLIAALTVLATMFGSVYERKTEIFVYNAVGIAPKYVFFMFFAEAFVYAVVGAVAGYLLSQGLGRFLTVMDWTGGLNMTFTSLATVWASLAVTASVFISTFFPAWAAMKIATPSDEQGWKLPPPDGDVISFALPFTFERKDRIAVLEFFSRIFLDHGEGGAGKFHAGKPVLQLEREKKDGGSEIMPQITTTIWLKPFDLGVSQKLEIRLPSDPETGEFIARIRLTRLSGTRESWLRLNRGFVAILRKHFLFWRAVSADQRELMYDEARRQLEKSAFPQKNSMDKSIEVA